MKSRSENICLCRKLEELKLKIHKLQMENYVLKERISSLSKRTTKGGID